MREIDNYQQEKHTVVEMREKLVDFVELDSLVNPSRPDKSAGVHSLQLLSKTSGLGTRLERSERNISTRCRYLSDHILRAERESSSKGALATSFSDTRSKCILVTLGITIQTYSLRGCVPNSVVCKT